MEENRAHHVVDALRARGIDAHLDSEGVYQKGIRIKLTGGREAIWDSDDTLELEAQVMLDGMLVGFVPVIEGSADFDEQQVIEAIASTDYDKPVATHRSTPAPAAPALAPEGGLFRRFLGGFRES
jgi:hypothetical protein